MDDEGTLVLTRAGDDRRRYDLAGVGSIRRPGLFGRASELRTVTGRALLARPSGLLHLGAEAVDEASGIVGTFSQQGTLRHGGEVVWNGLPHRITSQSSWKYRYELAHHDRSLLEVEARGWGQKPAQVVISDGRVDPGLVLFTLWLVQHFRDRHHRA